MSKFTRKELHILEHRHMWCGGRLEYINTYYSNGFTRIREEQCVVCGCIVNYLQQEKYISYWANILAKEQIMAANKHLELYDSVTEKCNNNEAVRASSVRNISESIL